MSDSEKELPKGCDLGWSLEETKIPIKIVGPQEPNEPVQPEPLQAEE